MTRTAQFGSVLRTPVALPPILEWMEQRMPELRRSPQPDTNKDRTGPWAPGPKATV
jgi:hypothetical protein